MPTIKRKVEMNLPQLIEWGWENPEQIKGKYFKSNVKDVFGNYSIVQFSVDSFGFKTDEIRRNDTFTVEIEEEITEDTKINKLLVKFKSPSRYQMFCSDCINVFEIEEGNIEAFYVLNDDLTLTLIWTKEEGLVE